LAESGLIKGLRGIQIKKILFRLNSRPGLFVKGSNLLFFSVGGLARRRRTDPVRAKRIAQIQIFRNGPLVWRKTAREAINPSER
jgi:hypothetical protein